MVTMNKKLLGALCILLATLLIFCACSKKKNDGGENKDKTQNKTETVWENIGDYEISSKSILDIPAQGEHKKLVGGCYDGERYAYYILESESKTSVICKYDTKDNSLKKTSKTLNIGDIDGVCCKKNTLVVLHGGKNISVLSSDFKITDTHSLIFDGCGIAYNKGSGRYVLLLENGNICVLDSDFEQKFMISAIGAFEKVSAITCNNKYIFTVSAAENGSDLVVYDWDGNYVSTASVSDVRLEIACVYTDDGIFYMGYQTENGGAVYKTVMEKR